MGTGTLVWRVPCVRLYIARAADWRLWVRAVFGSIPKSPESAICAFCVYGVFGDVFARLRTGQTNSCFCRLAVGSGWSERRHGRNEIGARREISDYESTRGGAHNGESRLVIGLHSYTQRRPLWKHNCACRGGRFAGIAKLAKKESSLAENAEHNNTRHGDCLSPLVLSR